MSKTTMGFSVKQSTKDRLNKLFPSEMFGEEKIEALLDAYENKTEQAELRCVLFNGRD